MTNVTRTTMLEIAKTQLGALADYGYTLTISATQADHLVVTQIRAPRGSRVIETLCTAVQQASEAPDDHARQLRSISQTLAVSSERAWAGVLAMANLVSWGWPDEVFA